MDIQIVTSESLDELEVAKMLISSADEVGKKYGIKTAVVFK